MDLPRSLELGGKSPLVVLADAGHAAYEDQPEAFTNALLAFLEVRVDRR